MQGRWIIGWMMMTISLLLTSKTHAAFSDSFDALRAELAVRAGALSNSDDKVEIKQYKACLKAVAAIDKSTTLAGDIKTAAKITKSLAKVFTNEFDIVSTQAMLASVTFSNNLNVLVTGVFSNLADEVQTALDDLQTAIDGLPAGAAKVSAQALHDAAQALVNSGNSDLLTFAKSLATAVKDVIKGNKVVIKGSGGGGGGGGCAGGNCMTATVQIGSNAPFQWAADAFNPLWFQIPGNFQVNGVRGTDSEMTIAFTGFTPAVGTYSLGAGNGDYVVFSPLAIYAVTSGTLTLTTVDLGNTTIAGTFSFTASDGTTTVTVSNGQFNMTNLQIF